MTFINNVESNFKTLQKLDLIIRDIENLMVSMKDDELLQVYRRTINLELASAVVEILDAKAIIYALHPDLIDQSQDHSPFDEQFYKNYVQKISQSKTGIFQIQIYLNNCKRFMHHQKTMSNLVFFNGSD